MIGQALPRRTEDSTANLIRLRELSTRLQLLFLEDLFSGQIKQRTQLLGHGSAQIEGTTLDAQPFLATQMTA